MSAPREEAKVKAIVAFLKTRNAWVVKTTGISLIGCPDLLVCYKGYFLGLEVKREHDGRYGVTPRQALEGKRIVNAGGGWAVVVEVDEVKEWLDMIDERERQWC